MKGHDPFVWLQRHGNPYGNGLLAYAAKPFADFTLPEQDEHLFFYHPGQEHAPV
jgi:hypothetical protein